MTDELDDVLKQAEETAASREADHNTHPYDRATLHQLLDAFDDQHLIVASWLLRAAAFLTMPVVPGAVATVDGRISLDMRWYTMLNNLVADAPPSWFAHPEQRGQLMKALAEQAAATIRAAPPRTSE